MAMMTGNFPGTWDQFFELAKNKKLNLGCWFDHVASWWNLGKKNDQFLFIHYEEAILNPNDTVSAVARFLNKSISEKDIKMLSHHLSIISLDVCLVLRDLLLICSQIYILF